MTSFGHDDPENLEIQLH